MTNWLQGLTSGPLSPVEQAIQGAFGGYVHRVNQVDASLPMTTASGKRVAVIGSGLAGMTAAVVLAKRGLAVELFERESYLGGKVGSWPVELADGTTQHVEHGFHAFFRHYHNLNRLLKRLGVARSFRPIEDYLIMTLDRGNFSFRDVRTTPVVNILSMLGKRVYTLSDVLRDPRTMRMISLLQYHPRKTFDQFDHVSFEEWSRRVALPRNLRLIFNSFSRAFFATPEHMSTAELIKSFHFYFLSHDGGLIYDYPDDDYTVTLLGPFRDAIESHGGAIHLEQPVDGIGKKNESFEVAGGTFDYVVLAADVVGARRIAAGSPALCERHPSFARQMDALKPSQGYAVLRLWVDRDVDAALPGFVITEHEQILDSISFYPRLEKSARSWAEANKGSILELHCYALPPHLQDENSVREQFLRELDRFFPSLSGMRILHQHLQLKHDFSAFHTGLHRDRPGHRTEVEGLYLAGDWVKLPFPAMLMEAACSSGLLCANQILQREGLRPEMIESVPPYGLLARR